MHSEEQWLEDLICTLPLLETLTLDFCIEFKHIIVINQHLKKFVYKKGCNGDDLKVTTNTPNLLFFRYEEDVDAMLNISMSPLCELEVHIVHDVWKYYNTDWYVSLINFLSKLKFFKNLSLHVQSEKVRKQIELA